MTARGTLTPNQVAGKYLRELRLAERLTQAKLAADAGIDRSRYVALENGREKITLTYAERLAPLLNLGNPSFCFRQRRSATRKRRR